MKNQQETPFSQIHSGIKDETSAFFSKLENEELYNNIRLEKRLQSIIASGNLEGLKRFSKDAEENARFGTVASDPLRQTKNTAIIMTVLVSRAAMDGGLSPVFAYSVADSYMKRIEELYSVKDIRSLMQTIQYDFCRRVAVIRRPGQYEGHLQQAIDYVHKNIHLPITVSDIADAVGWSRSHLSRRFRESLGFSLHDLILRCKLEESKLLLRDTALSLAEIAANLGFSSQSHFQTCFRKEYGITPLQFRKLPYHTKREQPLHSR